MAGMEALLRMAQKLEHEARGLTSESVLCPTDPRPTLSVQLKKAEDLNESATGRRVNGHVAPRARVNLRHKRSQEAVAKSVAVHLSSAAGDYEYGSDEEILEENSSVDVIVSRRHTRLLDRCLERAQNGTAESAEQLHWAHDAADMRVASSRLTELSAIRREMTEQARPLLLRPAHLGQLTQSHWGMSHDDAVDTAGATDWRAAEYARCMATWLNGEHAWKDVVGGFKQLVASGPSGPRGACVQDALLLWDTVEAVLEGASMARAPGVTRSQSIAERARTHLEAEYRASLAAQAPEDGGSVSDSFVNEMQRRDVNRMGHSEQPCWVRAYLCLRAGDHEGSAKALLVDGAEPAAVQLSAELLAHWPPYVLDNEGRLAERPASPAAVKMAASLTPLDYEANPFRCAVVLTLSRGCDLDRQRLLWHHLARREVVHFAQDRVWLHLALCVSESCRDDNAFRLRHYQAMAANAKVSEFSDPFLCCRVMLWSLCAHRVVSALIPPTIADGLGDFSLEGLHVCTLLLANNCISDEAAERRVRRALIAYITTLIPQHPSIAVLYLKLLPNAMESTLSSLCTSPEACHGLLGSVRNDGSVEEGAIVALYEDPVVRGRVILNIALGLKDDSCVLLACEMMLVALQVGDPQRAGRAIVSHLKAALLRVVEELDGGSSLSPESHSALRAAEVILPHLENVGEAHLPEMKALQQLRALTMLCCSVVLKGTDTWELVSRCTAFGLLPSTPADVPRCSTLVNTKCEVSTVRRALPIAVSIALQELADEMQAPSFSGLPGPVKKNLTHLSKALLLFESHLRSPCSVASHDRMQQAKVTLSRLA